MGFRKWNKYRAVRTAVDGEHFPSKLEANVYHYHKVLQQAGEIAALTRKATVHFKELDIRYKADGRFVRDGKDVWLEAKGMEDRRWRLIKKIWVIYGPGDLEVWKARGSGIYLAETIKVKDTI